MADGTAHPTTTGVTHNQPMKTNHYRVSVDKPYNDYVDIDLPVVSPDGVTKLGEAKNCFLQWPSELVFFDKDEVRLCI